MMIKDTDHKVESGSSDADEYDDYDDYDKDLSSNLTT